LLISHAQKRILFFERSRPGSAAYNVARAFDLDGPVDLDLAARAFQIVAERHPALRQRFEETEDGIRAVDAGVAPCVVEPLYPTSATGDLASLDLATRSFAGRLFDTQAGALYRLAGANLGSGKSRLVLVIHHSCVDDVSFNILVGDWTQAYEAILESRPPLLTEPSGSFETFVALERDLVRSSAGIRAREKLVAEFNGVAPTKLGNRHKDRVEEEGRDGCFDLPLANQLVERADDFAKQRRASRFHVFTAAFAALLCRYCGTSEPLFTIATGNRRHLSMRRVVGNFINTVPIRMSLESDPTFVELVAAARSKILSAVDLGGVPFDEVAGAAELHSAGQDGFGIMILENLEPRGFSPKGACKKIWLPPTSAAKLDLTVSVARQSGGGALLRLEYDHRVVDGPMAAALARHFVALLEAGLEAPETNVSALEMMSCDDRVLLTRFSKGPSQAAPAHPVHELILARCRVAPEATALTFPGAAEESGRQLTYGELDRWSGSIASALIAAGADRGRPVGVMTERGLGLPTAILGLLRAGGAYLALDPDHPDERLAAILAEAEPPVVLVARALAEREPLKRHKLLIIEEFELADQPDPPAVRTLPDQPSYILYTSGSTGRPKGSVNIHRGLSNRLAWMQRTYPIEARDVVLQKTPISFDVSVWELLWPLTQGARMVLAPPGDHRDCFALGQLISRERVTVAHFVPSMLRLFLNEVDPVTCATLRHLFCSGEVLPRDLADRWLTKFPGAIHNLYGPTEAAIDVTAWTCSAQEPDKHVPIGRPIDNTNIYILDPHRRLAPPYASGTIYIGGANLAQGYLSRPDLSAAAFVTVDGLPGGAERLYCTGDLGCWRSDGALQFLGRADDQIKFNGVRIELEELDQVLREHPAVADAVVVLEDGDQGDGFLAAHVVRAPECGLPLDDIADWMGARVPLSMAPAEYREIEEVPRTLSGKINRRSLPRVSRDSAARTSFRPPRNSLELKIMNVWKRVLKRSEIGIDDDFFAIGGDSLRSLRVAAALRSDRITVTVADLLTATTVEALAARIAPRPPLALQNQAAKADGDRFEAPRLIETLWQNSQEGRSYRAYVTSLHIGAPFVAAALNQAIDAAVARHPMLRASLRPDPDTWRPIIGIHPPFAESLEIQDLRGIDPARQASALEQWFDRERRSWDWESPRGCRFVAHRRSEQEFQLTLVEPWLDGWSVQTLLFEIMSDYAAAIGAGPNVHHAPAAIDYAEHVARERAAGDDPRHRQFWIGRLRGMDPTPVDDGQTPSEVLVIPVSLGTSGSAIRKVAAQVGVPLKNALLAVHMATLSVLAGRDKVVSGVMFNARPEVVGAEKVVGLYLNALPLSASVRGRSWESLARACWQQEAEVTPWRCFPSDQLRELAGEPLFDTLFNFTDFTQLRDLPRNERFALLGRIGLDQTYMSLCVQFGTDVITGDVTLDLEANRGLAERIGADRLAYVYGQALDAFCRNLAAPISTVDLLPEDSRQARPVSRPAEEDLGRPLYQMFVDRCEANPGALALRSSGRDLSFAELRAEVDRIAGALRDLRLEPAERVGIHLPRSWEAIASFLACVRLGVTFVPMPVDAPPERLAFIAADAELRAIVSPHGRAEWACCPILTLRTGAWPQSATAPPIEAAWPNPAAPLHILYTSGSTNRPKGVLTSNRVVLNRLAWMWREFPFEPGEVLVHKTSIGFVDSIWEIFGALLSGATTHIVEEDVAASASELAAAIEGCTRLSLVPSVAEALLHDVPDLADRLRSLRVLIVSGENLRPDVASALVRTLPATHILNLYGSTETGGDATFHEIVDPVAERNVVGRPLPGVGVSVVDDQGQPTLTGVRGEIIVSGACLADGYVGWAAGDPAEAERWIVDSDGRAAWRTGDLGYFREDGLLVIQGRKDRQMKVRGVRVEPSEIEAVLATADPVRRAVVVQASRGSLTAVVESPRPLDGATLRRYAADRLPAAMVPSRIIVVDRIPTTPTGKLDLLSVVADRDETGRAAPSPLTEMELLVIEVFRQVFPDRCIDRSSDFFELGGHSLLAGSIVARLRRRLQIPIPLRTIFQHAVLADLALELDGLSQRRARREA
jgi:amino acid adenylation domain-containing protein